LFGFIPARKISHIMPVYQYNSKVTSESHDILENYVASQFQWHKCYGTLRPRGNTKKPKTPDEMFAKTGIPDSETDYSDVTDSEFQGSGGYTPNDRTLRKHVYQEIKQEKHQREERVSISPAKRAKSEPFEIEDFNFDGKDNMEDFDADNLDLKVHP
jgi:hypothetical protein